jgi:hypothetical protein
LCVVRKMGLSLWNIFKVRIPDEMTSGSFRRIKSRCKYDFGGLAHPECLSRFSLQAGLLLLNAVMVLNRKRFLAKYGLDDLNHIQEERNPLRSQAVGLLHAVGYLKVPVIVANLITALFEILLGGA